MNPVRPDSKTLTCRCSGSFGHLVAECPHSWESTSKSSGQKKLAKVNIAEDEMLCFSPDIMKGTLSN